MLWKLWDDSSTDEFQERMLHQAIEDKEYLHILGTKEWKIPIHYYHVQVTASTKTKIDMLKKMVMFSFLNMNISHLDELSGFLHVDTLFIEDIVTQMMATGVVEKVDSVYKLTKIGEEQFKAGTILSEPSTEVIPFEYSVLNQNAIQEEPTNVMVKEDWELDLYRYSNEVANLAGTILEEDKLREYVQESGKVFEVGGNEKIISKIEPITLQAMKFAKCIEYQLYDLLENKLYARIWNGASGRWDERFEEEITRLEGEAWKSHHDQAIIEKFPERYEYLRGRLKAFHNKGNKNQKVLDILRGKDIRARFINSFSETKRKMLMVSPWISAVVVDRDMLSRLQQFAKQGKTLYISWGIAKNMEAEDRKPSPALLKRLQEITHEDGTQAVFVRWFGNQHNKEIVVDARTHLLGSYNWLSYRGEYNIRHESVVVIKEEKVIKDTTVYIEAKFINALKQDLTALLSNVSAQVEPIIVKNWMKELIMLDSSLEKRKQLSDQLMEHLRNNGQVELIHELASLWARYDVEDFGVRSYLSELLNEENFDLAKEYYALCQKHIKTSPISEWEKAPELSEYKEWFAEQKVVGKTKPQLQEKPTPKGNANGKKRIPRSKKKK
ncbi:phospholipase D-like domain-containing protein [Peribacillus sp. NPDC101480]|uniref:phospholipase D-like domain-containing protein n=1 Tax=Peribacillus sp. NPDC101480 TaxID=3390620 RepID=UPI003CFD2F6E